MEGMAFNLACRNLAFFPSIFNTAFKGFALGLWRWNNVPEAGYELLPRFFWVWSDFEAEAIRRWSSKLSPWHQPIVGGNLFLDLLAFFRVWDRQHYDNKIRDFKRDKNI